MLLHAQKNNLIPLQNQFKILKNSLIFTDKAIKEINEVIRI